MTLAEILAGLFPQGHSVTVRDGLVTGGGAMHLNDAFGRAAGLKSSWLMNLFRFAPRPHKRLFTHASKNRAADVKDGFVGFSSDRMAAGNRESRRRVLAQTAAELRDRFDREDRRPAT